MNLLEFIKSINGQDQDEFVDNTGTEWILISDGTELALIAETTCGKKHRVTHSAMEVCAPPIGFKRKRDMLDSVSNDLQEIVMLLDGLRDKVIHIFNNVKIYKGKEVPQ